MTIRYCTYPNCLTSAGCRGVCSQLSEAAAFLDRLAERLILARMNGKATECREMAAKLRGEV